MWKKIKNTIQIILILGFILFEELLLKQVISPFYNKIKSTVIMIKLSQWISSISHSYLLLFLFILPFIFSILGSILAFYFFTLGFFLLGVIIYTIKIVITIPAFIIFSVAKKQLLNFKLIYFGDYLFNLIVEHKMIDNIKSMIQSTKNELIEFKNRLSKDEHKGFFEELLITSKKIKRVLNYQETPEKK